MFIVAKTKNGWLLDVTHTEISTLYDLSGKKQKEPEAGQEIRLKYEIGENNLFSSKQNLFLKTNKK